MALLLSVNVGLPRDVPWQGKTVHTGIWKAPVEGRRIARRLNLDGDGQGDLQGHGGEHRAVFVYQIESYRYWQAQLRRNDFAYGQFGENFTIEGLADDRGVHRRPLSDRKRAVRGDAAARHLLPARHPDERTADAALVVAHHRPGFYFRVLEEGEVEAGDEIAKVSAGPERMTIAEIEGSSICPGPTGADSNGPAHPGVERRLAGLV